MNKQLIIALAASLPSLLLANVPEKSVDVSAEYVQTLQTAKTVYQQALTHKNVWRDTQKLIKAAEQAAEQGDYQKAQQLAAQAKQQGLSAIKQSQGQSGVGNPDYLGD